MLTYYGSKGPQDPETLHLAHFEKALAKIERLGEVDPNFENLAALREVYTRRKAAWDEANLPEQRG